MKYIKKITCFILVIAILIVSILIPSASKVEAQTLRELKNQLSELKENYESGKNKKQLTEKEIADKKANITSINGEIDDIEKEMENITKEIEQLEEDIVSKEEEIKKIINYYQLSSSEPAYLEYIFEAADFTDFIYRMAISEQLSNYNDKLIDEYNKTIEKNEQKKKDLDANKVALNKKQGELETELVSLNTQLGEILEENISIEEEIESINEVIKSYEDLGCNLDEDMESCKARINSTSKLPSGTQFFRPVESGTVTANYGWYYPWGKKTWHYGMDIGGTGHGANVYAMANGRVSYITRKASCGGNMLYMEHTINGVNYTSAFFHLATINVSVGDIVTYNTVVGTVGGNPNIETWDSCSTGTHLHIQFGYGHYDTTEAGYYTKFTARAFNPRDVLNLPAEGRSFKDRTTKY